MCIYIYIYIYIYTYKCKHGYIDRRRAGTARPRATPRDRTTHWG